MSENLSAVEQHERFCGGEIVEVYLDKARGASVRWCQRCGAVSVERVYRALALPGVEMKLKLPDIWKEWGA